MLWPSSFYTVQIECAWPSVSVPFELVQFISSKLWLYVSVIFPNAIGPDVQQEEKRKMYRSSLVCFGNPYNAKIQFPNPPLKFTKIIAGVLTHGKISLSSLGRFPWQVGELQTNPCDFDNGCRSHFFASYLCDWPFVHELLVTLTLFKKCTEGFLHMLLCQISWGHWRNLDRQRTMIEKKCVFGSVQS